MHLPATQVLRITLAPWGIGISAVLHECLLHWSPLHLLQACLVRDCMSSEAQRIKKGFPSCVLVYTAFHLTSSCDAPSDDAIEARADSV